MELTSWSILQPASLHSGKCTSLRAHEDGYRQGSVPSGSHYFPSSRLTSLNNRATKKPRSDMQFHITAADESLHARVTVCNIFNVAWQEVLLTGLAHRTAFWSCTSIDLSIKECKAVQNRHSTGKVIGVSEPAELAQINRSLNRLFMAAIWHDAWEKRQQRFPARSILQHRCNHSSRD